MDSSVIVIAFIKINYFERKAIAVLQLRTERILTTSIIVRLVWEGVLRIKGCSEPQAAHGIEPC